MKRIFGQIVDRLHIIWIVLTRKNIACFAFNNIKSEHVSGGAAVVTEIKNKEHEKMFLETIGDFTNMLKNDNSIS